MNEKSVLFENFLNNIISLTINNNFVDLKKNKLEIKIFENLSRNCLNSKINKFRLFLNNQLIHSNDVNLIYKCVSCGKENKISSNKRITSKLNGQSIQYCVHCYQKFDVNHMKDIRSKCVKGFKRGSVHFAKQKQKKQQIQFEQLSKQQKELYFKNNYTLKQWNQFISKYNVCKIDNFEINQISQYIQAVKTNNQFKFTPKIKVNNNLYTIHSVFTKCQECGTIYKFHWKKLSLKNKKHGNICRQCGYQNYFFNTSWPVKSCKNLNGDKLLYQSNYQKDFINWCNQNKILILNGPSLDYYWNNKFRKYRVDFFIPKLNYILQLKDFHIYHKEQVESGKWKSKQNIAYKFVNDRHF